MNTKSLDLFVVLIVVCIIRSSVYCIVNVDDQSHYEFINNEKQSDNTLVQETHPDIQNFISAPDAIVGLNANATDINDTAIDFKNNQLYPYLLSLNDVPEIPVSKNELGGELLNLSPQPINGFQMIRRSAARMVQKIQYFIQSIWNFFTFDTSVVEARHGHGHHKKKFKVKKKYKKYLLPLLIAYKLKFFTLVPVIISGLMLLAGSTGMAGFFFALFTAVITLKHKEATGH